MHRRPLNPGFNSAVCSGIKTTTIRPKPWPIGVPIQLYNWIGRPYGKGSTQADVVPVIATAATPITIGSLSKSDHLLGKPGTIFYAVRGERSHSTYQLWMSEGFPSAAAMDDWFRKFVPKPGSQVVQYLMDFRIYSPVDRYLVIPGPVTSRNDGDEHHISFHQLCRLYGVDPRHCVNAGESPATKKYPSEFLAVLRPRHDGRYRIPKSTYRQPRQ